MKYEVTSTPSDTAMNPQNGEIDPQNHEQQLAYELVANTNSNVFLTGRAGTGKTSFLRYIQKNVHKEFITLAPTGVAAINAGGDTIHSFFGLPLDVCGERTCGHMSDTKREVLKYANAIIIDEVSMVRCDIMDAIDYTMRAVLRSNMPFGGKQMIFVGDMFQLPPVVAKDAERQQLNDLYGEVEFFFYRSKAVKRMRLVTIEFQKVYRQEDPYYLRVLENIRLNKVVPEDLMRLNDHVEEPEEKDGPVITLASVNKKADAINEHRLEAIEEEEFVYEGTVEGTFEEKRFPVEQFLRLKVGAQVMFVRNDQQKRWVNGTLGKVVELSKNEIVVELNDGDKHLVPNCTWESYSYEYDRKERKMIKELKGTFTQYPLKLAWAITIHKSQGLTFNKMKIDLSNGMFVPGQLYVALSRVRSLDGLFLSKEVIPQYAHTNSEVLKYASTFNDEEQIACEIESGKAVYEAQRQNDYDEVAKQYLLLVAKYTAAGNMREAMFQAKRMLDTMICDESLYGIIPEVPEEVLHTDRWPHQFLAALLCLYAGRYEEALDAAEGVLVQHDCAEALYIKSRALAKLKRYKEADAANVRLIDMMDLDTPDAKVFFEVAILNELHLEEPGLQIMKELVMMRPKYDIGILALRTLMQKHGMKAEIPEDENREIMEFFNSDASEEEFLKQLKEFRKKAPKAVHYLLQRIRRQDFSEVDTTQQVGLSIQEN